MTQKLAKIIKGILYNLQNWKACNNYLLGLGFLAIGLPLSKFLTGLSVFVICFAYLFDKNWALKKKNLFDRKYIVLALASLYIVHLFWLLNTNNISFALNDLRIKLPLFLIPLILVQINIINISNVKLMLKLFVIANFIAVLISLYKMVFNANIDYRAASVFISHIRFSLFLCFSVCICFYFFIKKEPLGNLFLCLGLSMSIYLLYLKSYTGIVILLIVIFIFILKFIKNTNRNFVTALIVILSVLLLYVINISININNGFKPIFGSTTVVIGKTKLNNNYTQFNTKIFLVENNNILPLYFCEKELSKYWKLRSGKNLMDKNTEGNPYFYTLLRYLTSKKLSPDAEGVLALTNPDIKNILCGITNYNYRNTYSWQYRVYSMLYQINNYKYNSNSSGHSITMRFIFVQNVCKVFSKNFFMGTGTGDIVDEELKQYYYSDVKLEKQFRLRAHNQYLTFIATFGIIGFLFIILPIFFLITKYKGSFKFLFVVFLIIFFISMLNEDTLETQAGVGFFALFWNLFLLENSNLNSNT